VKRKCAANPVSIFRLRKMPRTIYGALEPDRISLTHPKVTEITAATSNRHHHFFRYQFQIFLHPPFFSNVLHHRNYHRSGAIQQRDAQASPKQRVVASEKALVDGIVIDQTGSQLLEKGPIFQSGPVEPVVDVTVQSRTDLAIRCQSGNGNA
jgi:hypothetical protein